MNNQKNNPPGEENRIEETLNSLDGCKRAAAPDFFYTRLMARMEKDLLTDKRPAGVLRPVYVVSALLLVLAVNVFILIKGQGETRAMDVDNNLTVQQSIAFEYNLNDINAEYDLNQEK